MAGGRGLFAELRNAVGEPGNFAAGRIAMQGPVLCPANNSGLRLDHGGKRGGTIAGRDRLLDLAHRTAHAGTSRFINYGPPRDLASGFLG